jgi:membrane associated rhomboid family serine protease
MLNERGFFPIGDSVRSKSFPLVTTTLILINVLVFILSISLPANVVLRFAFVPAMPSIITLFTHMFLHADLFHLLGNMWFFWIFGDNVEDKLGRSRFILLYFLSGIGAVALHFILNPASAVPLVGASGAISGVLGAYILLFPRAKVQVYYGYFMSGNMPAFLYAFIWFGFQLLYGMATLGADAGIAFFAHIGGFIAGMILVLALHPKRETEEKSS